MKILRRLSLPALALLALSNSATAQNYAWPANYQGVMLQGFYWDSYKGTNDSKWATLTAQADELSENFKAIWVPNGAKAASNPSMGYDPVYWFSNYSTIWGTETQLRTMISTFKEKGTDIIADVVVNHRSGVSNWTNFPTEKWNGKTYKLGPEHICSDDEVRNAAGQAKPTGAPDTGENFDGSRDLDHTNATVQDNISDYCKFLLTDMGYAGFRYDMVKGYAGKYTKIYNTASKPKYSVGEYFDGNYDAVAAWIESTGRQSAAFDFPLKFVINDAFASNDMSKLCWLANGTNPQPAGMIHCNYAQYAVTFVDNHDTYRDHNKFNGNVLAANAFIICSPGTPCVFLPHWQAYKAQLKPMIAARNAAGVHNQSPVKVLRHDRDCYMAEITGTKGKLVVKIGSAMVTPDGYTNANLVASGNGYSIWSTTGGSGEVGGDDPVNPGKPFEVYFDNSNSRWTNPYIHYWGGEESTWPGVKMAKVKDQIWKYTVPAGTTGILFNAGDGDATKTSDFLAIANHIYNTIGDQGTYSEGGDTPGNYPANMYLIGNLPTGSWSTTNPVKASSSSNGIYTWTNQEIVAATDQEAGFFSFITASGADWDAVNSFDRYGATTSDSAVTPNVASPVKAFLANVDASSAYSWSVAPGSYNIELNLKKMSLTVSESSSVNLLPEEDGDAIYFNLQGQRVENPGKGIYIKVCNRKSSKIVIR